MRILRLAFLLAICIPMLPDLEIGDGQNWVAVEMGPRDPYWLKLQKEFDELRRLRNGEHAFVEGQWQVEYDVDHVAWWVWQSKKIESAGK